MNIYGLDPMEPRVIEAHKNFRRWVASLRPTIRGRKRRGVEGFRSSKRHRRYHKKSKVQNLNLRKYGNNQKIIEEQLNDIDNSNNILGKKENDGDSGILSEFNFLNIYCRNGMIKYSRFFKISNITNVYCEIGIVILTNRRNQRIAW
jgi:hypothetical protein